MRWVPFPPRRSTQKVKHREDFRPFAPSVLAEHADAWFEVGAQSASHEFMLFACRVKSYRRDLSLPSSTRMVAPGYRSSVANQIRAFTSSYPVSLRTPACRSSSIRLSTTEPIVCAPTDAIVTFRKSGIDALFMDDVFLTAQA